LRAWFLKMLLPLYNPSRITGWWLTDFAMFLCIFLNTLSFLKTIISSYNSIPKIGLVDCTAKQKLDTKEGKIKRIYNIIKTVFKQLNTNNRQEINYETH